MGQPPKKSRLDARLLELGLAPSRQKAQALIMSGAVLVDDVPHTKSGVSISHSSEVRLRGNPSKYVSRGGDKIEHAFDHFEISLDGRIVLDVGASTGGFSDCALQRGASRVYAIDVGYNQLALKLREDPRVCVMEKTHANRLPELNFEPRPDLAVVDLSFIGLRKVLSAIVQALSIPCGILALVKPQFELGPEEVEKGGVVRSEEAQLRAVKLVEDFSISLGLSSKGSTPSPVKGNKKGNQEYFVYLVKEADS